MAERRTHRPPGRRRPSPEVRRRRATVRLVLLVLVSVAFLFVFVFPTRTLLSQRDQAQELRDRLDVLQGEREQLEHESQRLDSDAEIERIARERYNMVRPGETPYVVVPVP